MADPGPELDMENFVSFGSKIMQTLKDFKVQKREMHVLSSICPSALHFFLLGSVSVHCPIFDSSILPPLVQSKISYS